MSLQEQLQFLKKFNAGTYTQAEQDAFISSLHAGSAADAEVITDAWYQLALNHPVSSQANEADILRFSAALKQYKEELQPAPILTVHRVHFLRTAWFRYAAAVILLAGIGGYLLWRQSREIPSFVGNDKATIVKPGNFSNNKVILTLASGKKIELDNNNNKTPLLVKEGAVFDPREAGQKPGMASYNTITTPKGSQYQLIFPDGTKAWLNAASSIRFPTTFTGKERKVEVTGEIYFEVKVNKTAPFVVSSKGMEVQVLGTSFNVKAYEEETAVKTSLVEGAVKVNNELLRPGQAYLNGKIVATNLDQDIAWKNGLFNFEGLNIQEVMNQLKRWYDIEVVYETPIPEIKFLGKMGRDIDLIGALDVIKVADIHYRIEGKKVIISQ